MACDDGGPVLPQGGGSVKPTDRFDLSPNRCLWGPRRGAGGPVRFLPGRPRLWVGRMPEKGRSAAAVVRLLQSPAAFGIGGAPGGYPPPGFSRMRV